jgi:putative transposase
MTDKFRNKYRIPSARLQSWDYRWAGAYFITICTRNRQHYFGEIANGEMQWSPVGIIADILWHEIPHHARNAGLDAFVVMPNHVHGILILNDKIDTTTVETLHATSLQPKIDTPTIQSLHATSLQPKNEMMASISPKQGSVSTIIRSYKSAVTKHAHRLGFDFEWQTRFHEHIIRDQKSFEKIQSYITANPLKWEDDKFHK